MYRLNIMKKQFLFCRYFAQNTPYIWFVFSIWTVVHAIWI